MSGTSGDGVDSVLMRFSGKTPEILFHGFLPFSGRVRDEIASACLPNGSAELICKLNVELGRLFGRAAVRLCADADVALSSIGFIGSHGQTIRHQPAKRKNGISSTLQIGEPAEIAEITGCAVVSDFRQADIAAGGCGAPLAPIAHFELFAGKREDRIVHNLGGISNVTWLKAGCSAGDVQGFDTGPANSLLDLAIKDFSGGRRRLDRDGRSALRGEINLPLLDYCMSHPFFRKKPPKSTGLETFGADYFGEIRRKFKKVKPDDFLRTLSSVTARSAVRQALRFFRPEGKARWIVCGGGAYNRAVVGELRYALGSRGEVSLSSEFGVGEKTVEAALMAILARRTLKGEPGNLPTVTGAKRAVVLGKMTDPRPRGT
jgi:anhydro-N-acetylmuramic acid kinase